LPILSVHFGKLEIWRKERVETELLDDETRQAHGRMSITAVDRYIDIGALTLHIREWDGDHSPFLLIHGLASNAHTWDLVGEELARHGHRVVAVDQRGHGLSDKPDQGYDFATLTADLRRLIDALALEQPYLAGQSWGGNVVLAFAARYPGVARGYAFVDGGTIHLQGNPANSWEEIAVKLRPPNLIGTPRETLRQHINQMHADWCSAGVEATLANFEKLPDGTVRPWLTLERHMKILRALWDQKPPVLYPKVKDPVLVCLADDGNADWLAVKQQGAAEAEAGLRDVTIQWFPETAHDIHIHRPHELASLVRAHALQAQQLT
ncbi:MAG: alpha/beta hydrolase, partial [Anaerolineales bacterium]|nr:alpha/beta hydrolase [Anaerolineales bacterium]